MWVLWAFGSALFAGLTAVLAKCGIRQTDSHVATALRTGVVLVFSWVMVFITGAQSGLSALDGRSLLFLALSGLATGGSWLCYFRALQLGQVHQVAAVDKSSTVLTVLLAAVLLHEPMSGWKWLGVAAIAVGTYGMLPPRGGNASAATSSSGKWLLYAVLSAVFAALTAILGKVGIAGINSHLGTALRTVVVLAMAWVVVLVSGKAHTVRQVKRRKWLFLVLSGIATGASWLCYYRALQDGPAGVVVPIDKLSILITVLFSAAVLHERLSRRAVCGLLLLTAGTLVMLLPDNGTAALLSLDRQVLDAIRLCRTGFGDLVMPWISRLGDGGIVWIVLGAILLIPRRTRRMGIAVLAALALEAVLCNLLLKPLIGRGRPYVGTDIALLISPLNDASFPSGHTGAAVAAAAALFFRREDMRWLWMPAAVLAALIAFSRLYLYVHFPSDVLGGALLGLVCAYGITIVIRRVRPACKR